MPLPGKFGERVADRTDERPDKLPNELLGEPSHANPMQGSSSQSLAEPLLVALLGPTASGKTALSLRLAEDFGGY